MKRILLIIVLTIVLLVSSTVIFAGSAELSNWMVNGGGQYGTEIFITNVSAVPITVTVTFWKSDGSPLSNKTISTSQTTNANGEIVVTLDQRCSTLIYLKSTNFSTEGYTFGNATLDARPTDNGPAVRDYATANCVIFNTALTGFYNVPINGGNPF